MRKVLIIPKKYILISYSSILIYLSMNYEYTDIILIKYGFLYQNLSSIWISFYDIAIRVLIILSAINILKQSEELIRIRVGNSMNTLYFYNVSYILITMFSQSVLLMLVKIRTLDSMLIILDLLEVLTTSIICTFFYNIKNPRLTYVILIFLFILQRVIFTFYYAS